MYLTVFAASRKVVAPPNVCAACTYAVDARWITDTSATVSTLGIYAYGGLNVTTIHYKLPSSDFVFKNKCDTFGRI